MQFAPKTILLKDGRSAVLRSPGPEDAAAMLDYLKCVSGETEFLLRYPEEWTATVEQEGTFLAQALESPNVVMISCFADGLVVGNCTLTFQSLMKSRHRAELAVAIRQAYWGLGLGTILFQEILPLARERGISQLELEFIEGNTRARALYEKQGFRIVGIRPNGTRLRDGTLCNEYIMVKELRD